MAKAKFSRAGWRWPPNRKGRSRSRWSRRRIIELGLCPDQSRQITHLPPAEVLAKDRLTADHASARTMPATNIVQSASDIRSPRPSGAGEARPPGALEASGK